MVTTKTQQRIPFQITLAMMPELFDVPVQSAYRWNSSVKGRPPALVKPDGRIGTIPVWLEDTLVEWAAGRRRKDGRPLEMCPDVLARLKSEWRNSLSD